MSRTSEQELRGALKYTQTAAQRAGVDTSKWALHGGSKTNGIQYALATGSTLVKLGFTRTEAWNALRAMSTAFEMVGRGE